MSDSRRVFVTGANGRVGLPLVRRLVRDGHQVTGLARDEAKAAIVRETGADCITGDLDDLEALKRGVAEVDVIYHLAGGLRGPGRQTAEQINHQGTRRLVQAVLAAPGAIEALVFTSTCAVYGDRSSLWVDETIPPHPNTNYGRSKAAAEGALLDSGLPVRVARLAAVYGPGFPFMLADGIARGRAWLPGEGRNYTPTVHVEDAVDALVRIQESGSDGEIYNLADPNPLQLVEFYGLVHQHVGGRPVRFWSTWIPSRVQYALARRNESLQSRLGRRPRFTPDNLKMFTASVRMKTNRLQEDLGFTCRFPHAREGLAATFASSR